MRQFKKKLYAFVEQYEPDKGVYTYRSLTPRFIDR